MQNSRFSLKEIMALFRRKPPISAAGPRIAGSRPVMSDGDVVGAALSPGFGPDPTAWHTINRDGRLRQEMEIWDYPSARFRQEEVDVPSAELEMILATADRIGFRDLQNCYEDYKVTDEETLWIGISLPDGLKSVEAYAPIWLVAQENNGDMVRFLELWACIHRFAPFPSPYNDPERRVALVRQLIQLAREMG